MQNLDALLIFARVAEMTSFTRAAESLGIQKGRVSMVIRQLERDVGVALLHRTTRSVQLTDDGRAFYSRARDLLADVQELQSMFAADGARLPGKVARRHADRAGAQRRGSGAPATAGGTS